MPIVSSRTGRLHPKQSSASKSRDGNGEKRKKRKMAVEKDTEDEKQQVLKLYFLFSKCTSYAQLKILFILSCTQSTKDDKRRKTNENLYPDDVDSSSSSDETSGIIGLLAVTFLCFQISR